MATEYDWTTGDVRAGGRWLQRHRERMGLSQRDVDHKTGISAQNLSNLENGTIAKPSMAMLVAIGALYGVTPNEIAEAYSWWRPPTPQRKDERIIYLESVLARLTPGARHNLLQQIEALAQLAERDMVR